MNWEMTFAESPWGAFLDTLRSGSTLSASRLLALTEGEGEEALEDAFRELEDRQITLQIRQALDTMGITLVDHIVVADGDFVSMAASGMLL